MDSSPMAAPDGDANSRCCVVAAWAVRRAPVEAIAELRRRPGPLPGDPLPASFLKHADEQTVIGLAAVSDVVQTGKVGTDFHDWGVLASPRYLGRWMMAFSLQRYREEGCWGVSPHLIPHRSLHSLSGTVSQALKLHGPNFGTGGGPASESEGLLAAVGLLHGKQLPGVWVVLTRVAPEPQADGAGALPSDCSLEAIALALQLSPGKAVTADDGGMTLSLRVGSGGGNAVEALSFPRLWNALERVASGECAGVELDAQGLRLELARSTEQKAEPMLLPFGQRSFRRTA
jgi:hypothetical protein